MHNFTGSLLVSLDRIYEYINGLKLDLYSISLLIGIEKFDAQWSFFEEQELMVLGTCPEL